MPLPQLGDRIRHPKFYQVIVGLILGHVAFVLLSQSLGIVPRFKPTRCDAVNSTLALRNPGWILSRKTSNLQILRHWMTRSINAQIQTDLKFALTKTNYENTDVSHTEPKLSMKFVHQVRTNKCLSQRKVRK